MLLSLLRKGCLRLPFSISPATENFVCTCRQGCISLTFLCDTCTNPRMTILNATIPRTDNPRMDDS
jgi:hypothetical protein